VLLLENEPQGAAQSGEEVRVSRCLASSTADWKGALRRPFILARNERQARVWRRLTTVRVIATRAIAVQVNVVRSIAAPSAAEAPQRASDRAADLLSTLTDGLMGCVVAKSAGARGAALNRR
jgi:hypothetical protein